VCVGVFVCAADELSCLASYGSNVIGEHIVLGIPIFNWLPRVSQQQHSMYGLSCLLYTPEVGGA
jgi:hypothetical protein